MALQLSVAVRNAQADAWETAIGTAPILRFFDGALPADCAAAAAGTKVAEGTLPSDWSGAAASGTKTKSGTWSLTGSATGFARYYRIYDSTGTTCHEQDLISQAWAASTAYSLNQQVSNGGNVYRCTTAGTSAGSGGPSGTGSGITDGTAVWAYVGSLGMTMDNTSVAVSQSLTVNTFSRTMGNA